MTQFTIPEGSGDVIQSYIRSKAAAWTVPQMVDRVEDGVRQLEAAARAIPAELLAVVAEGQEWSPIHTIRHVTAINLNTMTRCAAVASTGELPATEPPALPEDREGALARHAELLDECFATLRAVPEDAFPEAMWEHPLLGDLPWRQWLLTVRVHCLGHAGQLGEMHAALA